MDSLALTSEENAVVKKSEPEKIWIDNDNFFYRMKFQDSPELSVSVKLAFASIKMHDRHAIVDGFKFMRSKSYGGMPFSLLTVDDFGNVIPYSNIRTIELYFTRV